MNLHVCLEHLLFHEFPKNALKISLFQTSNETLREKCPYWKFLWSIFSHVMTKYGDLRSKSPYQLLIRENTDQKNSEYGHFLCFEGSQMNNFLIGNGIFLIGYVFLILLIIFRIHIIVVKY